MDYIYLSRYLLFYTCKLGTIPQTRNGKGVTGDFERAVGKEDGISGKASFYHN